MPSRKARRSSARSAWQGVSSVTRELLATSPSEGECVDFKENSEPLTAEYMSAMANAAALAGEDHATVLVGVAEVKDPKTGATSGRIVGLASAAHKAAETIAQRGSMILPTPARVETFEENRATTKPILRVHVTPTAPPHYDNRGRRATRQGTTTRPMSDAEMLQLLQARESRRFEAVAEDTANLMMGEFRVVGDDLLETIRRSEAETGVAIEEVVGRLNEIWSRLDDFEGQLDNLPDQIDTADPESMEWTLLALLRTRQTGAVALALRREALGDADIDAIERVINAAPDHLRYVQNSRELGAWRELSRLLERDDAEDIPAAIRRVVAAHGGDEGDRAPVSIRALAARIRGDDPSADPSTGNGS